MTINNGTANPPNGLTLPSPAKSVYGDQTITLTSATPTPPVFQSVKLTLTGGMTVGRGSSTHTVSSVTIDSFTVDTVLPVISLGSGANPLLTEPIPYMNQTNTPSTFEIQSTKAGTIALSLHTATSTAILAITDTTFTLASITPSNNSEAYMPLTVTVTDALGNDSAPFTIADPGDLTNSLYTPPKDAYIIDKALPEPVPSNQVFQSDGDSTINFQLTAPTANSAPYKNVLTLDPDAITITGTGANVSLNAVPPSGVQVQQNNDLVSGAFVNGELVINLGGTLATTDGSPTDRITVSYDPALETTPAKRIQDLAGNEMGAFGPIAIIVSP